MANSNQSAAFEKPKLVSKKVFAQPQQLGDGAILRNVTASELKCLDPFLSLYHYSRSGGFADHPHRGFETITYVLEGSFAYQDFAGHKGTLRTGDVQIILSATRLTCYLFLHDFKVDDGKGIIHSEMTVGEGTKTLSQLWINLSSQYKMIEPRIQDLLSEDIPEAEKDGVQIKVIAGESTGVISPGYTQTPMKLLDFCLNPGAQLHQSIPESMNSFVYVIEGEGVFGSPSSSPIMAHNLLVLGDGDGLSVWNTCFEPLRFLLFAGQPLNEQVVLSGPFVMNTQAEIEKTREDYHHFKDGFEMGKYWKSQYGLWINCNYLGPLTNLKLILLDRS